MATDALITTSELEVWTQRPAGSLAADQFALQVIWAVSVLLRDYGDPNWTAVTPAVAPDVPLPDRAKLIGILKAKNYFKNPDALKSESTGPLSEGRATEVAGVDLGAVHNMTLTDAEKAELAALAGTTAPGQGGLTIIGRGNATPLIEDVYVTDQSGSDWMIPFVRLGDNLYPAEG